ncbi:MAG: manganese efflux pump MntP family protein [Eggerthellaceae bacterium]|jgi:putative Mn2+ efflux pump MntP
MNLAFFINAVLLGVGLAMDAFSVSMANGLGEPDMRRRKLLAIAATFGGFQFLMPMIGWVCVHTVVQYFSAFQLLIPWIALGLLGYIGGKMLWEGIRGDTAEQESSRLSVKTLLLQGVATSIDALSVGFAIAAFDLASATVCSLIIMAETFAISVAGVLIGRAFGTRLAGKASILGGAILIGIGLEIFISNIFF